MSGLRERWRKWWGMPDPSEPRCWVCRREVGLKSEGGFMVASGHARVFCSEHVGDMDRYANDIY